MKKLVTPILILIVLAIGYFGIQRRDSSTVGPKSMEDFINIDTTAVNKISMRRLGGATMLTRAAGVWYVAEGDNAYKADTDAVDRILNTLATLKVGNVISDNPANQMKFQVDTLTGSTVEIYSGDNLLAGLVVGKMSSDFGHTYVRKSGNDEVYLATGMLTHLFTRTPDDWRDHVVLDVSIEQVASLKVSSSDEDFIIALSDSTWQLSTPPYDESNAGDQDSINRLLTALCGLEASGFATPSDSTEYDFSNIQASWTITLSDGSTTVLEAAGMKGDTKRHFVRVLGDETVFILPENVWNVIAKTYNDLLSDEKNS